MFELVLWVPQALVEPVSDLLQHPLGALSVSVEDADANTHSEQALFGEPGMPPPREGWMHSVLTALFTDEATSSRAAATLLAQIQDLPELKLLALRPLPDQDWVRLTQSQFNPVQITPQFWVVPSWHQAPANARHVIRLDPGLAFGTGTHPTTQMCLRWIAGRSIQGQAVGPRVLDYGCGSGILAMAACLFGATEVDAVDIDDAAVQAARSNAAANHVTMQVGRPEIARGTYGLVLANILATPLKLLAPLLCSHVAPGGVLVLAGILERQAQALIDAYAPHLALTVADRQDGWILMTAWRPQ